MPEITNPNRRSHPFRSNGFNGSDDAGDADDADGSGGSGGSARSERPERPTSSATTPTAAPTIISVPPRAAYAELQVTTNFTFLTGASHPEEYIAQASVLGNAAVAITDVNTVAGIVRAHVAAREQGVALVVGTRLRLTPSPGACEDPRRRFDLLVYPTDAASYGRMCRLLTVGKRRARKGACHLELHDVLDHAEGLMMVVVPPPLIDQPFIEVLEGLRRADRDEHVSLAATVAGGSHDATRLRELAALAAHVQVPLVATNDVHHHLPERRALQDVVTAIRHGCTLDGAGLRLHANGDRYMKPPEMMTAMFASYPDAIRATTRIAERAAGFSLDQLGYRYPDEICPAGMATMSYLTALTWAGAHERWPAGISSEMRQRLEHEFALIDELDYAPYFLTVQDIVAYARGAGILCQGRGAAANSVVCYCLGLTAVDPERIDLLFERFISRERNEPPDIDIDFEHERREEVIQYLYRRYGRDRAALTAEVITYRGRSAVRDVGKSLGLSLDLVDRLAKNMDWWNDQATRPARFRELGLDPNEPTIARVMELVDTIVGFPRHLSQHVGGFVITQGPLCEMVPVENAAMADRTVIEWDKDDIDAMGMLKVDVLGLGMLTCVRKAFDLVARHRERRLTLATVPAEDPEVYDMICDADTVGVFQIESRAQMSMLPRLRPRSFYDLVIEVAIVRPGPIQGDMVHPYLRRRNGEEPVFFPRPEVAKVLGRTLGVPLFQEQAMALAVVGAGFTPGEADELRRAMAAWKRRGDRMAHFERKFLNGMRERGYPEDFAERCFKQIRGFSEYGFPESHAASFALIVYVSAWLKRHEPAAFAAALLNSQPMGFYPPAQIVRDAEEHGVPVRAVDVNHSAWDCTLEPIDDSAPPPDPLLLGAVESAAAAPLALRLGMRLIKGLGPEDAVRVEDAVLGNGTFSTIEALRAASGISVAGLRRLAAADAFRSMRLDRQAALWSIRTMRNAALPLFGAAPVPIRPKPSAPSCLPPIEPLRDVLQDYDALRLSLRAHPMSFLREELAAEGVEPAKVLRDEQHCPGGRVIAVAGLALVRQRPATAAGIIFMTLEDETGIANLIIRPKVYEAHRLAARHGVVILARGTVERRGQVVHILVRTVEARDEALGRLASRSRDFH